MVVYIEFAVLENFLLDALLLSLALKFARAKISVVRLFFASLVGAAEAVLFPLFALPAAVTLLLKLLGGALASLVAAPKGTMKSYLCITAAFFVFTFLLGGTLSALSPPIAGALGDEKSRYRSAFFVLAGAGIFFAAAHLGMGALFRYKKIVQSVLPCKLSAGGKTWNMKGFADTGNCLTFRGEPVCLISSVGALALFRGQKPIGRITVSTVNGKKNSPVFLCPKMEIGGKTWENVRFTAGDVGNREYQIILHTAFSEGIDESSAVSKGFPQKIWGK